MSPTPSADLHCSTDGRPRCGWCGDDPDYIRYHDEEWGQPVSDDRHLFEKICLEGFQAGLSWLTILRKRDNFRAAFAQFEMAAIAQFNDGDIERLMGDRGIVRNRQKIAATINNARRAIALQAEFGSLAAYIWQWEPQTREPHRGKAANPHPVPSVTATSTALSRDLKRRGWTFFGPTTAYAFMQSMGLVNDHVQGCICRETIDRLRQNFVRPG